MTEGLTIDIAIEADGWSQTLPDAEVLAETAARAAYVVVPNAPRPAEASVLLSDDAAIQILNRDWRGQDKPTNVLSFPGLDEDLPAGAPALLGDVAVALETTVREAKEQNKTLADHFCHLIVHGMLHVMGYDHERDDEAERMEGLEAEVLKSLGIANPYVIATPAEPDNG